MAWLALSIALWQEPTRGAPTAQGQWLTSGSVYRGDRYHLGVRPAVTVDGDDGVNWGAGLTVQVSTPWL